MMEQKDIYNKNNGMLAFQPKSDVQKLREFFIQIKDKWPEDMIEVEEAIQLFAKYEKQLIAERDTYRKMWEGYFKYSVVPTLIFDNSSCDPGKEIYSDMTPEQVRIVSHPRSY